MKCTEKDCNGQTDERNSIPLRISCDGCASGSELAYPCKKCGRLYWESGDPVSSRTGKKAFLLDGKIVHEG